MLEHNYFLPGKFHIVNFETWINSNFINLVFNFKIKREILHSDDIGEEKKFDGKYCF